MERERGRERGKERDEGGDGSERGRERKEREGNRKMEGWLLPEGRWESVQLKLKFARERKIEKGKSRSTNT